MANTNPEPSDELDDDALESVGGGAAMGGGCACPAFCVQHSSVG